MRPLSIGTDVKPVRLCINDGTEMTRDKTKKAHNPHSDKDATSDWVCPLCGHVTWQNEGLHRELQRMVDQINGEAGAHRAGPRPQAR